MTDIFRLDKWIPDSPTVEDFKSKFTESWNYPDKNEREKDSRRKAALKSYHKNKHKNRIIINQRVRLFRINNKEKVCAYDRFRIRRTKIKVIAHYSNNTLQCHCCGLKDINNLTIDHIAGNGKQHRATIARHATGFYRWLIRNNFPSGYQVLCFACNVSKNKSHKCQLDHSFIKK